MDIIEVRNRVIAIDGIGDDPEATHSEEDILFENVLKAISEGAKDPAGLAREALKVLEQNNRRWYA